MFAHRMFTEQGCQESTVYRKQLLAIQLVFHYLCCFVPKSRLPFSLTVKALLGLYKLVARPLTSTSLHQFSFSFRSKFGIDLDLKWVPRSLTD